MSAAFTPGPWQRGRSERFRNDIMAADGLSVASVVKFLPDYREKSEANANLIAAAPDLYAALHRLISNMDELDCIGLADEFEQSIAALAKARGTTSMGVK